MKKHEIWICIDFGFSRIEWNKVQLLMGHVWLETQWIDIDTYLKSLFGDFTLIDWGWKSIFGTGCTHKHLQI